MLVQLRDGSREAASGNGTCTFVSKGRHGHALLSAHCTHHLRRSLRRSLNVGVSKPLSTAKSSLVKARDLACSNECSPSRFPRAVNSFNSRAADEVWMVALPGSCKTLPEGLPTAASHLASSAALTLMIATKKLSKEFPCTHTCSTPWNNS